MSYYNTTREAEAELKNLCAKAANQDSIISRYFFAAKVLSPSEVEIIANQDGYHWPLTSIRRTLNTLTRKSVLEKTDMKREGSFGRNEFIWQLREEE